MPATKERGEIVFNPDEPVHESWSKLSPFDFERERLEFNPYDFGQRSSSDNRFYCKMHEKVYEYVVCTRKNTHVPQKYFDVQMLRDSLPEVMALMDYHGISGLMECNNEFSPELLREFYATFIFRRNQGNPGKCFG